MFIFMIIEKAKEEQSRIQVVVFRFVLRDVIRNCQENFGWQGVQRHGRDGDAPERYVSFRLRRCRGGLTVSSGVDDPAEQTEQLQSWVLMQIL